MSSDPKTVTLRSVARHAELTDERRRARDVAIKLARQEGASLREIGAAAELTAAGIKKIVERGAEHRSPPPSMSVSRYQELLVRAIERLVGADPIEIRIEVAWGDALARMIPYEPPVGAGDDHTLWDLVAGVLDELTARGSFPETLPTLGDADLEDIAERLVRALILATRLEER